jgi:hypothetical protein
MTGRATVDKTVVPVEPAWARRINTRKPAATPRWFVAVA